MGGRGKADGGAAANPKLQLGGGTVMTPQEIAKALGFKNLAEMQKTAEFKRFIEGGGDVAHFAKYLSEHRGMGSIGPVMLRIGLPRDKLLDIIHALKPLRDHGILTMSMPLSYKGYEDPFEFASHASPDNRSEMDVLAQIQIDLLITPSWLKRLRNTPFDLITIPESRKNH